jgi:hypothetical protein
MTKPVRRVVTGHLADGRSTVVFDGPAPNVKQRHAGNGSTLVWVTEESPAAVAGVADRAAGDVVVQRGTNHAWINRGRVTCRLCMVFVDAEEPPEMEARK